MANTQQPQPTPTPEQRERTKWLNTHCYGCGKTLTTPLDQITEDNLDTANADHEACF